MKYTDVFYISECCNEYGSAEKAEMGICPRCKEHTEFRKEVYEREYITNAEYYGTYNCYRPDQLHLTDEEYELFG